YTLRLDGFVSVSAGACGGELVTSPVIFEGDQLSLNFATSAAGTVRVELQDVAGKPLENFSLADCEPLFGDTVDRSVAWKQSPKLAAVAGTPVRLRFRLEDADLYSFRFTS
ncbi:MAG: hypothetical protein KDA55_16905, partial [Planctomycetales bacterium]|nr:hypothetical protein [Planctomycetales bacterium]